MTLVAHQPADFGIVTPTICCGDSVARRQVNQLDPPAVEEGVAIDEEGVGPLAHESCEGRFDLRTAAGFENLDLQTHGESRRFHVSQRRLCIRSICRIDKDGNANGSGHKLAKESQSLCGQLANEKVNACQVAARPAEAGHKTEPDWVFADNEDDGDRRGCRLGRQRRSGTSVCCDHGDPSANQLAASAGSRSN